MTFLFAELLIVFNRLSPVLPKFSNYCYLLFLIYNYCYVKKTDFAAQWICAFLTLHTLLFR
jgi:hypothetical protein